MGAFHLTEQMGPASTDRPGRTVDVSKAALDPEWDAFVEATAGGQHLQTSLWAQVKAKHGWQAVRLRVHRDGEFVGGAQLLVRRTRVGAIAYCPRGPLFGDNDAATLATLLDALARLARGERILYIKIQPPVGRSDMEPILREHGFVASDMQASPMATVRVGLCRPSDEILADMRAATRKNIRKAARKGIVVRAAGASGLPAFGELLAVTGRRQGFAAYSTEYAAEILRQFGKDRAELLLAERDGEVLSGVIVVGYGETVVYILGGWSGRRAAGVHPNELVHWHAIQWARERGYHYYDLYGIGPSVAQAVLAGEDVPESGQSGPTHFKLGFGGEVALDPGTYDRSFHRLLALPVRIAAPRLFRLQALVHRAHSLQGRAWTSADD